jgi:hypothetical protein
MARARILDAMVVVGYTQMYKLRREEKCYTWEHRKKIVHATAEGPPDWGRLSKTNT